MLYINGEQVDLANNKKDYKFESVVKEFNNTITDFTSRFGDNVLFRSIYEPSRDDEGNIRNHKPITLSNKANVIVPGVGPQKWVYSPEGATIKDGVAIPTEIANIMRFGSITLNLKEEADYIFFLTKTGKFEKGRIYIHDENANQDKIAQERMLAVKLDAAIYGEDSPLNETEALKEICLKWGLSVVGKSVSALKNNLYDKIREAEKQKSRKIASEGLHEFLSDLNDGKKLEVGSDVQLAIDKGLLAFNKQSNEWGLTVEQGHPSWVICRVPDENTPIARDYLIKQLVQNNSLAEKVSLVLSGNAHIEKGQIVPGAPTDQDKEVATLTIDTVDDLDYGTLGKAYSEYGLGKPVGLKKEKMREELKALLKEKQAEGVQ